MIFFHGSHETRNQRNQTVPRNTAYNPMNLVINLNQLNTLGAQLAINAVTIPSLI